jgi:hypothetical protein
MQSSPSLATRAIEHQAVFKMLAPHLPELEPREWILWCQKFDDNVITKALTRVSRKFPPGVTVTPVELWRYLVGVPGNIEREAFQGRSKA